jgi:flagellar basal body-associated protein FliL
MEPIKTKSNSTMYVVVGIIVILAIVFFAMSKKKEVEEAPVVDNITEDTSVAGVNEVEPSSPEKALTYQQALVKYKDKRIQFTADCQASPDRQVFKVGTSIMLDNRAQKATTVKVGSTYNLGSYGFRIITLNNTGTFLVDCGVSQNVATVIVS